MLTYTSYLAMYCLLWKVLEACLPSLTPDLHDKLDEAISQKDKKKGKEATWNSYAETNGLSLFLLQRYSMFTKIFYFAHFMISTIIAPMGCRCFRCMDASLLTFTVLSDMVHFLFLCFFH